jgi:hypothetical protein
LEANREHVKALGGIPLVFKTLLSDDLLLVTHAAKIVELLAQSSDGRYEIARLNGVRQLLNFLRPWSPSTSHTGGNGGGGGDSGEGASAVSGRSSVSVAVVPPRISSAPTTRQHQQGAGPVGAPFVHAAPGVHACTHACMHACVCSSYSNRFDSQTSARCVAALPA